MQFGIIVNPQFGSIFTYAVELQDVFESDAFIFLVFELCRNGELFDYLTSVVTLSEKKTRYIMRYVRVFEHCSLSIEAYTIFLHFPSLDIADKYSRVSITFTRAV